MNFEASLIEELNSVAVLNGNIYPLNAPEGTPAPYIVFLSSEGMQERSLNAFLPMREVNGEINILCSSYEALKTTTDAVIQKLYSFVGRSIGTTTPVFIQDFRMEQPVELYEQEVKLYRSVIDFTTNF